MDALRLTGNYPGPARPAEIHFDHPIAPRRPGELLLDDEKVTWSAAAAVEAPFYGCATAAAIEQAAEQLTRETAHSGGRTLVTRSGDERNFNLGYDPARLAGLIRTRDERALRAELIAIQRAQLCAANGFGGTAVTIAAIRGAAIGLGFELALAHDVLIAERGAQFGFPEVECGLFPPGGGPNLVIRRLGRAAALPLLLSGRIYSAEELHALGLIDLLAEEGECEAAARDFVERCARRSSMQRAVYAGRRRVRPLEPAELCATADLWVRTALGLSDRGLDALARLAESWR